MKNVKILILSFLFLLIVLPISACDDNKELFEYKEPVISKDEFVRYDSNMKIDASDSEEAYNGQEVLSFTETMSGITCSTKAFLGERGLYIYTYVDDPNVYYSSERQFFENDSVEYYIDPNPEYSASLEHLKSQNHVRTDCLQLRIDVTGKAQTWYGRRIGGVGTYPWAPGHFDNVVSAHVDGTLNTQDGANGYSIEVFVPYYEMKLSDTPEAIGLLVAFNNIDNREDTGRTWYSYKGMSHGSLNSYIPVGANGFILPHYSSNKELTANFNDEFYKDAKEYKIEQVDEKNQNPTERASFKFMIGDDGLYLTALVKDRVHSYASDNIFANDGIEILVDTRERVSDNIFANGVYRFSYDIVGGTQTDICMNGFNDYVTRFNPTLVKTKVENYNKESLFNYKYEYTYEVMIPYEVLGLTEKPKKLNVAFAVKTPNEKAYILNRRDGAGNMEAQDWLWIDRHYPQNGNEYFTIIDNDFIVDEENFEFDWSKVSSSSKKSENPNRYTYKGYAADDGLYINMVQYVNNHLEGGAGGDWAKSTHIEMEVWNHEIGYGWDGTYFAFFTDGSYYVNNQSNIMSIINKVTVSEAKDSNYKYAINYEIYIGFANNLESNDDPYGYVQFMSHTPNEDSSGYEKACMITKDTDRVLWTDDCNSYGFGKTGINSVDKANTTTESLATFDKISGDYKNLNNKLLFTEFNSLVLNKEVLNGDVTFNTKVVTNSNNLAGVVFDYKDGNYLYLAIDGARHELVLYKVVGQEVVELERNYISASYHNNKAFDMSVTISDGKYYCSYFNTLYFTGSLVNNSTLFGLASSVPGAQFYNIEMENKGAEFDVDTLIIGHSYTELWDGYKADFTSIGLGDNIYNAGISGSHSMHWNKLEEEILVYSPELLIYNIGVNDLFFNTANSTEIAENIKTLLLNLKAKKADLEVALFAISHTMTTSGISSEITKTNQLLKQLSNEYSWIKYVDLEYAFCDQNNSPKNELFTDGLHPTASAYKNIMIPKIAEALGLSIGDSIYETNWDKYVTDIKSSAPTRYQVVSHAADNGLYIKVEQYVNEVIIKADQSDWNSTHVEMELWNHGIGYGWNGTYFAFFANGTYYINNWNKCRGVYNDAKVIENPAGSTYKYTVSYNIYIEFDNNLDNPQDGPYAFCQFMFYTPNESNVGYENCKKITKDGWRALWTDKCNSYEVRANGIVRKDGAQ